MRVHRAALVTLLVVGALAVVGSAGAVAPAAAGPAAAQNATDTNSTNASLGVDISSFMQSSAAEISGAVETGMWSARFNSTTNESEQRRLVERRTADLRAELNALQDRRDELVAAREAGNISEAAYKAQIGRLVGRIDALRSAVNATAPRARQVNANVDAVEMLRSDAAELGGPEIAAVARNSSGVAGPPTGIGNGDGPPANAGNGNGDGERGPPTDAGNASTANDSAPPANAGDAPRSALGDANASVPGSTDTDTDAPGNGVGATGSPGERGSDEPTANRTDGSDAAAPGAGDSESSGPPASVPRA